MRRGVCKGYKMNTIITWFKELLEPKPTNADLIRYVRTEFAKETRNLKDDDCLEYYNYYLKTGRS